MTLPPGLTSRPLTMADAPAVAAVMAAQELADIGEVFVEEADIIGDWQKPSVDVSASTIGIFDGDELVGYAELAAGERADAGVIPSHRGRGIGTALAFWMQDRAREIGTPRVGMPVPVGSPGAALLTSLGYKPRWTSWVLRLPRGAEIEASSLPSGYTVREAVTADYSAVHRVVDDAFGEWSSDGPQTYQDFEAETFQRPGFEPWHVRVATAPDGEVVGASLLTVDGPRCFVSKLAVRADQRDRGLARALLADSFAIAREHGADECELATDDRTGALSLYEKVGMVVTSTWVNLAIDVPAAQD